MTNTSKRLQRLLTDVADQRKFIEQNGGSLAGYVRNYGSANDAEHYGDGGEAIYDADIAYLRRLESELNYWNGR